MKRWLWGGSGLVLVGVAVWALSGAGEWLSPRQANLLTANDAVARADDPLIVHEWGTFTSYSGSDGGRLEFRPLFDDDLPDFVADRSNYGRPSPFSFSKLNYRALVRMETPVTYFYTQQPRDVRVKVAFPQGLLTEFYPPAAAISPPFNAANEPLSNSSLDWGRVRLIPEPNFAPNLGDARLEAVVAQRAAAALPPHTDYNNHYKFARETDAALVHFHRPKDPTQPFSQEQDHFEKFLFYRGLGNFKLPVRVQSLGDGKALVNNSGSEPIGWAMLLDIDQASGSFRYTTIDGVASGQQREIALPAQTATHEQLVEELTKALISTGLYPRETTAMVNTWRSSWFGEQGTRLLYFVPQKLTEELLPLTIEPKPASTVRVLVGRLDLLTPEQEQTVSQLVRESAAARQEARARANETNSPVQYPLPEAVRKLGRLAEPALTRVRHASSDRTLSDEAASLIHELKAEAAKQGG